MSTTAVDAEAERTAASGTCDGCTLCCSTLNIAPLGKPAYRKCRHIADGGCAIYHDPSKPEVCRGFICRYIQAHAEKYPGLGVLHLDAHADLRTAYEGFTWSHASIMYNVVQRLPGVKSLVQVAIRDMSQEEHHLIEASQGRVRAFFDATLQHQRFDGVPWNRQVDEIVSTLPEHVYLSFDIDGLDPVLCPHTGTPVPGGLSFPEANALIAGVVRSGRTIVGFDLTEVAPDPEGGEWDGNVGARLLYKMIGWMLKSQRP